MKNDTYYLLPLKSIHSNNITGVVATATEHCSEMKSATLQGNIKRKKPRTFHQNHFSEMESAEHKLNTSNLT
jgi:hypothetical protein